MENNRLDNRLRKVKTFVYRNVRKRIYGELSEKEKAKVLQDALDWEERMFTKDGCKECDRFDDFMPRFNQCDTFEYKAIITNGVGGRFGGIQVIGTITNKVKLRNFLENQPDKLPTFRPSDWWFPE